MITDGDLAYGLSRIKAKQGTCRMYADYFAGDHNLSFATDSFRNAFGYLFKTFSYNRCKGVVDAFDDRLTVNGWQTDGKQDATETPLEKAAGEIWRRNNMAERQSEVHSEALRSGVGYLIVWPNDDAKATFYPNHNHLIATVYDDESCDEMAFAVKTWREERGENAGKWRVTVYEPDTITRWITKNRRTEPPEKMAHLTAYDGGESENPYGIVPVFAFKNSKDDDAGELRDVVPLQDALNKQVADMMIALEFLGWPQRVVTGLEPMINPDTGKPEAPFDVGKDRLITISDAAAKWGEFAQAAADQFTAVQDNFDMKIARVSGVPVHWLNQTGDFPSGESLKTAEAPFVAKVTRRQTAFGSVWAKAMRFALEVDAVADADKQAMGIQPIWAPAESRSEQEMLNAAAMRKALSVPEEQIWAEMGYSVEEIKRFTAAAEQKRQQQLEQFSTAFDRGQVPVGGN